MSQLRKRRNWTATDKMRIVLARMKPGVEISELCRREGISPTQFYSWKKQLTSSADAVFGPSSKKKSKSADPKEDPREKELQRMKSVIAEITAENLELKTTL